MKDLYAEVTNAIIEELEKGVIPWQKPWTGLSSGAISHATGKPYSLINQLLLNVPGEYVTFNQCKQEGGHVKKGAKSKTVIFWKILMKEKKDSFGNTIKDKAGNVEMESLPVLRYVQLFHLDDCEGLTAKYTDKKPVTANPDKQAEQTLMGYIEREKIKFENTIGDKAFYNPARDLIQLPLMEQFTKTSEYYSTAFHEAVHSTGHKRRLDRFSESSGIAAFGSETYSKEELVAEIGAACCMNELGLNTESSFKNSAAYIQSWLMALKNDKRLIVSAAARAEKAVKMILNVNE